MLKKILSKSHIFQRWGKKRNIKKTQPVWTPIIRKDHSTWTEALNFPKKKRVLIPTSIGAYIPGMILESLLAAALTLRDAEVHILLCDSALPACFYCNIQSTLSGREMAYGNINKKLCDHCVASGERIYSQLGLTIHKYSDYASSMEQIDREVEQSLRTFKLSELDRYTHDGLSIGEHAVAGALRFFARGNLDREKHGEPVLIKYLKASLITASVLENLLDKYHYDSVVFHHGIYVPMGIIGEVCRKKNVPVVNWNPAYRQKCFIFSHHNSYHHTLIDEPVETWQNLPWSPQMESEIMDYLKSRWVGTRDWIWFHEKPVEDTQAIVEETGIDFSRPVIGLLTNVMWDAKLHFPGNVFPDMLTWLIETIDYFAKRPDLQLLIRVHPAEIRGTLKSRQPLMQEIAKHFPQLPSNIFVIPPESRISTYAAMMKCDSVIIYGTKTGVELASLGIPVIVGGEAWIKNKGLTIDASTPEQYFRHLQKLPLNKKMDDGTVQAAKKYAYHFFLRRMIPIASVEVTHTWPPYRIAVTRLDQLKPGNDPGLDVICSGILEKTPFIYPAEVVLAGPEEKMKISIN